MLTSIQFYRRFLNVAVLIVVWTGVHAGKAQTLAEAIDATNLVWTTGGDVVWFAQTTNTHDGIDAVSSGIVSSNQTSWIETTVIGPATLKFWQKIVRAGLSGAQISMSLTAEVSETLVYPIYYYPNPAVWVESTMDLGAGTNVIRWSVSCFNNTPPGDFLLLDEFNVAPPRPPFVTYQTDDQTVYTGGDGFFYASAVGSPPLLFQWRKDEIDIANATNATLHLISVATSDAGDYSCVVSNSQGFVVSSNASLTVLSPSPPFFTSEPASVTAYVGQSFYLWGGVEGSPPFSFQWRKNGTNVTELTSSPWQTSASLTMTNLNFADAGNYTLFVTNDYGSVESSNAVVTVIPSVAPVITKHPRSLEVAAGVNTWMSVAATGDPEPTYKWTKLGEVSPPPPPPPPGPVPPIPAQPPQPARAFTNVSFADAGIYFATAKNYAGEVKSREALLTVLPPITNLGSWWQGAEDIYVTNGLAFLAQGSAGFSILSVSNPASPMLLGGYNTAGFAAAIQMANGFAYVADGSALQIFAVTNPFNPTLVGSYNTPNSASDLVIRSNLAYLANGNSGLLIINVSNPAAPSLLGSLATNLSPRHIALWDHYAYLTSLAPVIGPGSNYWVGGMLIVDISNPSHPIEVGRYGSSFTKVAIQDGLAHLPSGSGMSVINVRNPATPYAIGGYSDWSRSVWNYDLQVVDEHAYLLRNSDSNMNLTVLDVRDPSEPIPVGSYTTPGQDYTLFVDGNRAYTAGRESPLKIIETPFHPEPTLPPHLTFSASPEMQLGIQGRRGFHYDVEQSASPAGLWQILQTILLTNDTATFPITPTPSNAFFRVKQLD